MILHGYLPALAPHHHHQLSLQKHSMKLPLSIQFILVAILFFTTGCQAQTPVNWNSKQLMEPTTLATDLNTHKDVPVILSIGPDAVIPNSVEIGMVKDKEGLDKLKQQLKKYSKDQKIVVYCGCCPFDHCPNARPAVAALKELGFTNFYLLDLPHNIRKDWIEKGYPVNK
jgi:hypothetical protein